MNRLLDIYQRLLKYYGKRDWWPAETPFEMAIGAVLTQNTNWQNVEKAIARLRAAGALKVETIDGLARGTLEELIQPSGFFRQKAERLQGFTLYLREHHASRLETMLEQPLLPLRVELLALKGIGPETADSILLYAGQHLSFVIDAYTCRIFERLGILSGAEKYAEIRELFMQGLPAEVELYNEYHALIVAHAKEHCRKKPLCTDCPLAGQCLFKTRQSPHEV